MHRRLLSLIAVSALAVGLAACGSSSKTAAPADSSTTTPTTAPAGDPAAADAPQITIDSSLAFHTSPVKAGSTVTVKNNSGAQHTVTSDDAGGFDITVDPGETKTFTAPAAGTYNFHCNIHTFMKSTLTVT